MEKNGDLWRSLVTVENTTKVHKVKPTFYVCPREGPPRDPLRAYAGDFWDYLRDLWGISEGSLRNSETSREFPGSLGLIWEFLGISWFGPVG